MDSGALNVFIYNNLGLKYSEVVAALTIHDNSSVSFAKLSNILAEIIAR